MLNNMCPISVVLTSVAKVIEGTNQIELFKKQYEFLDNVLLAMQNFLVTDLTTMKVKCEKVTSFLYNYGYCCIEVKDYVKAIMLCNQATASRKLAFGDKSNNCKNFAGSYSNLGHALENSNHLLEARTAYQTSIDIYKQASDYQSNNEKSEHILRTTNNLLRVENKLKN